MPHRIAGSAIAGGVGVREEQLHMASGIRTANLSVFLRDDPNIVSGAAAALGTPTGADQSEVWIEPSWSAWSGRMPYPMTPAIIAFSSAPGVTKRLRVRVTGLDQFWSPQTEITPWVAHDVAIQNIQFPLSKVFAYVAKLEYMSEDYDSDTDTIAVGITNVWDPIDVAVAGGDAPGARSMLHLDNLGIGTPRRISPYGGSLPVAQPDIIGNVVAYNVTQGNVAHIPPLDSVVSGFTVGVSVSGFEGYAHKIGFGSPDAWVTKILDLAGAEFVMGGVPNNGTPRADDTIEFFIMVRSSLGTRYESNAETAYPWG